MDILIVSQFFWPENFRINDVALSLKKRGHQVTVLTGLPNYPQGKIYSGYLRVLPYREIWNGISIIRIPIFPRGNGGNFCLILNYFSYAILATLYCFIFNKNQYDLSFIFQSSPITQALPAIFLKKFKKIPCILWLQDLWPENLIATGRIKNKFLINLIKKFSHYIYKQSNVILTQSQSYKDYLQDKLVNEKSIFYYPNTCEDFYQPFSLWRAKLFDRDNVFKVMFAGNIGTVQSITTILLAAEKLKTNKEIKWFFVGDGSMRSSLQNEIVVRKLDEMVIWLGTFSSEEMPYLYAQADVMLVTLTNHPVFSLVLPSKVQSYLACAKPIISMADGETYRTVATAQAGIAVQSGDSTALANAVLEMSKKSTEERFILGRNGYQFFIENFDKDVLIEKLEIFFKNILRNDA